MGSGSASQATARPPADRLRAAIMAAAPQGALPSEASGSGGAPQATAAAANSLNAPERADKLTRHAHHACCGCGVQGAAVGCAAGVADPRAAGRWRAVPPGSRPGLAGRVRTARSGGATAATAWAAGAGRGAPSERGTRHGVHHQQASTLGGGTGSAAQRRWRRRALGRGGGGRRRAAKGA
jgi:hypothetical protein